MASVASRMLLDAPISVQSLTTFKSTGDFSCAGLTVQLIRISFHCYSSSFLIFQGSSFLVLLFMQVLCAWFYERVGQFAPEEIIASSVLAFTSQGILELRKGKEGKVLRIKRLISSSF